MFKAATIAIVLASISATLAHSFVKRDGDHGHDHGYDPSSTYEEKSHEPLYEPPAASYGAPSDSYEPATSYGEPSYEPSYLPAYNPLPDLTPILIAVLALIGLSLMFPNNVRIDTVKKKRSAGTYPGKIKEGL